MVSARQVAILLIVSLLLWMVATAYIRWMPAMLIDPLQGSIGFAFSIIAGWLSIVLIRWAAQLRPEQLLAGVSVVGAVAMMIDGAVLRWAPRIYGDDDTIVRLGAAWLLWGYGVCLALALIMAATARHKSESRLGRP
jgi:hypothetical protein